MTQHEHVAEARFEKLPQGARATPAPAPQPAAVGLTEELADMRRQLARVTKQVARSTGSMRRRVHSAALHELDQTLAFHEVSYDAASALLRDLDELEPVALRRGFEEQACEIISSAPELAPVTALVGPPGVGKTAMIAKLAVRYGVAARRSVHIISYDSHRIASAEPLRTYSAILGVSFESIDSVHILAQSLKEHARKDLILIDTPGYSAADLHLGYDLGKFLSTNPQVETHLLLSCAAKTSDVSRMVDRYDIFNPARLIFTMLDQTESYGAIVNESLRAGLPVSFLSAGPRVPEDLEPASQKRIVELLLQGPEARAAATA